MLAGASGGQGSDWRGNMVPTRGPVLVGGVV